MPYVHVLTIERITPETVHVAYPFFVFHILLERGTLSRTRFGSTLAGLCAPSGVFLFFKYTHKMFRLLS